MKNNGAPFGGDTKIYEIANGGVTVRLTDAGAALVSFEKDGFDAVAGFKDGRDYLRSDSCMCVNVGRYAGRIAFGRFTLDGKEYDLSKNNGVHHIHGGFHGFGRRVWTLKDLTESRAVFSIFSEDGEDGYPADLTETVAYSLDEKGVLSVVTEAEASADTVINPTLHAYFNLGDDKTSVLSHRLTVFASRYTPLDENLVWKGGFHPVEGTPFDFRKPKPVADAALSDNVEIVAAGGLDTAFALDKGAAFGPACVLTAENGRSLLIETDRPAAVVYTANFLDEKNGKFGPLGRRSCIAIETEAFPNSVNVPSSPSTVLKKGEKYRAETRYTLSAPKEINK